MKLRKNEPQWRPRMELEYLSEPLGLEMLEKLTGLGLTWNEIARRLGCEPVSLIDYVDTHTECLQAVSRGAILCANTNAECALYKRATGYSYDEETYELKGLDDQNKPVYMMTKKVRKHLAPDVNALKMWLKNREPDRWSDDVAVNVNQVYISSEEKAKEVRSALVEVLGYDPYSLSADD